MRSGSSRRTYANVGEMDRKNVYMAARQKQTKIDTEKLLKGYNTRKEPTSYLINIQDVQGISLPNVKFEDSVSAGMHRTG